MKTISLQLLHKILEDAYAVCIDNTLYSFFFDDEEGPLLADSNYEDYISLKEVDGDIEVQDDGELFFWIGERSIHMIILKAVNPQ